MDTITVPSFYIVYPAAAHASVAVMIYDDDYIYLIPQPQYLILTEYKYTLITFITRSIFYKGVAVN